MQPEQAGLQARCYLVSLVCQFVPGKPDNGAQECHRTRSRRRRRRRISTRPPRAGSGLASRYRRAARTAPRWEPATITIMLDPDYIELLGVLDETEHNAPTRAFLAKRGEGIERIAFTAVDSAAGAEEIRERGYAAARPDRFRAAGDHARRQRSRRPNSEPFSGRSRKRPRASAFSPASTRRGRLSGFPN